MQIRCANITVQRSYIGPITQGTGNGLGIGITADNAVIGGAAAGEGNVISGNDGDGIQIASSVGHTVIGNFIGTNPAGTAAFVVPNGGIGVNILISANFTLGSNAATGRNVISGNAGGGVVLNNAVNVTVAGNLIGTDVTGTAALGNVGLEGLVVFDSDSCLIGTATGRNVISGNAPANGVRLTGATGSTILANNYIGTDVTGTVALANGNGIVVDAGSNTIGTTAAGNVISGNDQDGIVFVIGANNVTIQHNIIGLDATGNTILGNGVQGVNLCCTSNTLVGGLVANQGNVISGNGADGIGAGTGSASNTIQGNIVGLNAAGNSERGNGQTGIDLAGTGHLVGGSAAAARNVVSGNSIDGIALVGNANSISVSGNYVGTDVTGAIDLGNLSNGLEISSVTGPNVISGNVFSGNDADGVAINGSQGQSLTANTIGRNATNTANLANGQYGIDFLNAATGNTVSTGVIAGNTNAGVYADPTTDGNNVANNSYFGNGALGIDLDPVGVNGNDAQDPDTGANTRQNFPTITYATSTPTSTQIGGTINSNPNTALAIHVYSNTVADPSGNGEGETHLGSTNVTTDGSGNATFIVNVASPTTLGRFITGTANGPHGTSEFSGAGVAVLAAAVVQFSSATYNVSEGTASQTITVTRTGDTASTVTVSYATSNGTATAGQDYTAASGTLTFGPGVTSQTFSVPITNDTIDEPNETVNLTLSNPSAATLGLAAAVLTIADDDATPAITINDMAQNEGNAGTTNMTFTVMLSNPSSVPITVDFATADGTATAGSDYTATSGTLTFTPGVTTQTINVPIIGDATVEPNETFFVNLFNTSAGATIGDNQGQGTITNEDIVTVVIPTLSEWMLLMLAAMLALAAGLRITR